MTDPSLKETVENVRGHLFAQIADLMAANERLREALATLLYACGTTGADEWIADDVLLEARAALDATGTKSAGARFNEPASNPQDNG